jgi:hypothetical protein
MEGHHVFKPGSHVIFENENSTPIKIKEIIYEDGYGQVSVLKAEIFPENHDFHKSHGESVLILANFDTIDQWQLTKARGQRR